MTHSAAALDFRNTTDLDDGRLVRLIREAMLPWRVGDVTVRVRFSRGADFSGACYYADRRIFVNLGRHLVYPYRMGTHLARAKNHGRYWARPIYAIDLGDGYEVVLFIFLHELYHLLIKTAGRNRRQKESMCDRFAARVMVDRCGCVVRNEHGTPVPRDEWDFQDLEGFVAAARAPAASAARRPVARRPDFEGQLMLF